MNSKTKINVMIKILMNKTKIIMRFESRFRLIFHIDHNMNFDEICDDVELNIKKLKTRHHIFVIIPANHQLVFDQSFLIDLNANYDYHFDEVYIVLSILILIASWFLKFSIVMILRIESRKTYFVTTTIL
jgi:hypothetical protein